MERVEAVKQAFVESFRGYLEARRELMKETPPDFPSKFSLAMLAPVAAEIYRQLTGRLIVEVGSEKRLPEPRTLERIQEQIQNAGLSPDLVASYDIKLRQLDNEQIIRIIIEAPEKEVTEKDGA